MNTQISASGPEVAIHNGKVVTTSQDVADYFGKLHKNVVQKIESLDCSGEFMTANFSAVVVKVQAGFDDRDSKAYQMTKDGFMFLVMGFTGKEAAKLKEAYIAEFNRMEMKLYAITSDETIKVTIPSEGRWLVCYKNRQHQLINIDGDNCVSAEYIHKLRHDVYMLIQVLQNFSYRTMVISGDTSPTCLNKPLIEKQ